ncbi:MAG: iron-sulfur cluster assembly scaffold protein [Nanoarchaeota archaeon]|nr:iron-sulfur cluster assembly scaffold protein [Nanoarchaeota archaeon]
MTSTMYKEELLEIYSNKENFGELKNKTHQVSHTNPLCNDEIIIDLEIKKGVVHDAKFHGISCFVSTISAAVLTEKIKGMTVEEVNTISKKDLDQLLGINITPGRIPCELMPLEALRKLQGDKNASN